MVTVSSLVKSWSPRDTPRATRRNICRICWLKQIIPTHPGAYSPAIRLFVSSAGRPDLLGADHTKELAEKQFHTLRDFYLKLPDHVMIYPNHGAGSPCGADIGDRLSSTIGYERKFNRFLQFDNVKSFTDYALTSAPPVPKYYPVMKKVNAKGPEVLGNLPRVPGLPPKAFKEAIDKKAWRACGHAHHACVWRWPYSRCAEHWRLAYPFDLGGLDARSETSRFSWCSKVKATSRKSCGCLFAQVIRSSPGIW